MLSSYFPMFSFFQMNDSLLRRLFDSFMTSVFSLSSNCSFYGVWVVQDLLLEDIGRETDDPVRGRNGAISYVRIGLLQ